MGSLSIGVERAQSLGEDALERIQVGADVIGKAVFAQRLPGLLGRVQLPAVRRQEPQPKLACTSNSPARCPRAWFMTWTTNSSARRCAPSAKYSDIISACAASRTAWRTPDQRAPYAPVLRAAAGLLETLGRAPAVGLSPTIRCFIRDPMKFGDSHPSNQLNATGSEVAPRRRSDTNVTSPRWARDLTCASSVPGRPNTSGLSPPQLFRT